MNSIVTSKLFLLFSLFTPKIVFVNARRGGRVRVSSRRVEEEEVDFDDLDPDSDMEFMSLLGKKASADLYRDDDECLICNKNFKQRIGKIKFQYNPDGKPLSKWVPRQPAMLIDIIPKTQRLRLVEDEVMMSKEERNLLLLRIYFKETTQSSILITASDRNERSDWTFPHYFGRR
mmetsp:Transcript_7644/g.8405  ORF Transcript_7644/g.8405 Transcript_7644/m.8405 type:complete len:175 (+) Transcript_7644:175-699(+)